MHRNPGVSFPLLAALGLAATAGCGARSDLGILDGPSSTSPGGTSTGSTSGGGGCPPGTIECAGRCVDPSTDDDHCGECGNACATALTCVAGACASAACLGETGFPGRPIALQGPYPYVGAVADLDGDGKLDVIGASSGSMDVAMGNGNGTFGSIATYSLAPSAQVQATAAVVTDLDGDGKLDIAVAVFDNVDPSNPFNSSGVSVFRGNGDGTFGAPLLSLTKQRFTFMAVGDLDGDGRPDLVVNSLFGQTYLFHNLCDGTFAPTVDPSISGPGPVALADLDGDGALDLVAVRSTGVDVHLGHGDGTFAPGVSYPVGTLAPGALGLADLDGDGSLDIAAAGNLDDHGAVNLLRGNGDGTFSPPAKYPVDLDPVSVLGGDVDGDGRLDLVVGTEEKNLGVLRGNGDGTLAAQITSPASGPAVAGDLDGDGRLDLLVGSRLVLLNGGKGTFTGPVIHPVEGSDAEVVLGDVDGDGALDLIVSHSLGLSVSRNDGKGGFGAADFASPNQYWYSRGVAAADLDGDGDLDLASLDSSDETVRILLNHGDGTFASDVGYPVGKYPSSVALLDVDGDGRIDVVVADSVADTVSVHLGTGQGVFAPAVAYPAGPEPIHLGAGDFDGDGRPDLVVVNWAGSVSVISGAGNGTFASPMTYPFPGTPESLVVADLNGDGLPDLALANNGLLGVMRNQGNGVFSEVVEYPLPSTLTYAAAAGDLNGDGSLDLVAVGDSVGYVLLNLGDGTFGAETGHWIPSNWRSVALGDVNDDGRLDLVVPVAHEAAVAVLLSTCLP